jgi:hypothetical protein
LLAIWTLFISSNSAAAHFLTNLNDDLDNNNTKEAMFLIKEKRQLIKSKYDLDPETMRQIDESLRKAFNQLKSYHRYASRSRFG